MFDARLEPSSKQSLSRAELDNSDLIANVFTLIQLRSRDRDATRVMSRRNLLDQSQGFAPNAARRVCSMETPLAFAPPAPGKPPEGQAGQIRCRTSCTTQVLGSKLRNLCRINRQAVDPDEKTILGKRGACVEEVGVCLTVSCMQVLLLMEPTKQLENWAAFRPSMSTVTQGEPLLTCAAVERRQSVLHSQWRSLLVMTGGRRAVRSCRGCTFNRVYQVAGNVALRIERANGGLTNARAIAVRQASSRRKRDASRSKFARCFLGAPSMSHDAAGSVRRPRRAPRARVVLRRARSQTPSTVGGGCLERAQGCREGPGAAASTVRRAA
jgi:hypothetical protein